MKKRVKTIADPAKDAAAWRQRLVDLADETIAAINRSRNIECRDEKLSVCQTGRYLSDSITKAEAVLFFEAMTAILSECASE